MAFVYAKRWNLRGLPQAVSGVATGSQQAVVMFAMLLAGMLVAWPCSASADIAMPAPFEQPNADEKAPARGDAAAPASTALETVQPGSKVERLAADRDRDEDDEQSAEPAAAHKDAKAPRQVAEPSRKVETGPTADRDDDEDDDEAVAKKPVAAPKRPNSSAQTAQPPRKVEAGPATGRDDDEDEDDAVTRKPAAAPKGVTSPAHTAQPPRKVETSPAADRDEDEDEDDAVSKKPPAPSKGATSPAQTAQPSRKIETRPAAGREAGEDDDRAATRPPRAAPNGGKSPAQATQPTAPERAAGKPAAGPGRKPDGRPAGDRGEDADEAASDESPPATSPTRPNRKVKTKPAADRGDVDEPEDAPPAASVDTYVPDAVVRSLHGGPYRAGGLPRAGVPEEMRWPYQDCLQRSGGFHDQRFKDCLNPPSREELDRRRRVECNQKFADVHDQRFDDCVNPPSREELDRRRRAEERAAVRDPCSTQADPPADPDGVDAVTKLRMLAFAEINAYTGWDFSNPRAVATKILTTNHLEGAGADALAKARDKQKLARKLEKKAATQLEKDAAKDLKRLANKEAKEATSLIKMGETFSMVGIGVMAAVDVLLPSDDSALFDQVIEYVNKFVPEQINNYDADTLQNDVSGLSDAYARYARATTLEEKKQDFTTLLILSDVFKRKFINLRAPEKTLAFFVTFGTMRLMLLRDDVLLKPVFFGVSATDREVEQLKDEVGAYAAAAADLRARVMAWRIAQLHCDEKKATDDCSDESGLCAHDQDAKRIVSDDKCGWSQEETDPSNVPPPRICTAREDLVRLGFGNELDKILEPTRNWKALADLPALPTVEPGQLDVRPSAGGDGPGGQPGSTSRNAATRTVPCGDDPATRDVTTQAGKSCRIDRINKYIEAMNFAGSLDSSALQACLTQLRDDLEKEKGGVRRSEYYDRLDKCQDEAKRVNAKFNLDTAGDDATDSGGSKSDCDARCARDLVRKFMLSAPEPSEGKQAEDEPAEEPEDK